jgi:hypothetical protein
MRQITSRRRREGFGWVIVLGILGPLPAPGWRRATAQEPSFSFELVSEECGGTIDVAPPLSGTAIAIVSTLRTSGNPGPAGASAWSSSIAVEGARIIALSTEVTDAGPLLDRALFVRTLTTPEGAGVVSTVILSEDGSLALPPEGEAKLLRIFLDAALPLEPDGATSSVRVRHLDGLRPGASAEPVSNSIQWNGAAMTPELGAECALTVRRTAAQPCPDPERGGLQGIIQTRSVLQVPELYAAVVPTPNGPANPGELRFPPGPGAAYVGWVSDGLPREAPAVQGWSLSIAIGGDISLESATFDGTIAAPVSGGGLFDGGLRKLVIVDPALGGQGQGVMASTVISLTEGTALEPDGTATVLALGLRGEDGSRGTIRWRDGLDASPRGGIAINVATVAGETWPVTCYQSADVLFARPPGPPPARFFRGDANSDGGLDLSDALWIAGFLFLGGPAPYCPEAADANDDSALDLSDAVSILQSLFVTGLPLPPPERCEDPQPDIVITECPPYSTTCP